MISDYTRDYSDYKRSTVIIRVIIVIIKGVISDYTRSDYSDYTRSVITVII